MDITSVELHPAGSSLVHVLSFRDPRRLNPYNVSSIEGLDADNIRAKYYGISANSDDQFYNLMQEDREVTVSVQLNPDFSAGKTYSELRDDLYRSISSSRTGLMQLQFKFDDAVVAAISGWITKFESDLFAETPVVKMTITTNDPVLKALDPVVVDVTGFGGGPINIPDLVSTAPHGFDFTMTFPAGNVYQSIKPPGVGTWPWEFKIAPAGGFLAGDVLHVSTDFKTKAVYIVRGAATIHIADGIQPGSVWPVMFPGDNEFILEWPGASVWSSISYYETFWGV